MQQEPPSFEHYPLVDALDHEILMHRDAHFGGLFSIMLDYYGREGKGVQSEFTTERIARLSELENQLKQNLAVLFLTSQEMQKVADARDAYQALRSIYEVKKPKNLHPQLIADLILSEEEEAETEVERVVAEKDKIVPALIELLRSEHFYDPLFPGYGYAPSLAVKCLGRIGDKRALISLFEALGQGDFFADDQILRALKEIGEPAKSFLLRVVAGRPLNEDNEKAAIALIAFKDDLEVPLASFELLKQADIQKDLCLSTYLVLACSGLQDPIQREAFKELSHQASLNPSLKQDMQIVIRDWGI